MFEVAAFQDEFLLFAFNIAADDEEAADETVSRLNEINPYCHFILSPVVKEDSRSKYHNINDLERAQEIISCLVQRRDAAEPATGR